MSKIHVLDFEVANLIAAGEVVDRPASVIKELLENAIDSGAHTITVEVKRGGVAYMRVTDNGCGISFDDLPTSILRHATSKISNADDLEHIGTLGFRGEALAAIASVSKLRIISRPEGEEKGGILIAEGGSVVEHSEIAASAGTSVIVEELFANVPARRKFLKKDVSETAAIFTVVERIALSRPDISFRFIADGTMKLRTEGNGDLKSAIYSVLGREFWSRTIKVSNSTGGVTVSGYIGMPDTARANRNGQIFFINGRYIRSKTASAAIEQAYTTFIPTEKFPACVLSIEVSPFAVDVNVHPAKLEVKFSNERVVFESVYYAVRPALESSMTPGNITASSGKPVTDAATENLRRAERVADAFVPVKDTPREQRHIFEAGQVAKPSERNFSDYRASVHSASSAAENRILRLDDTPRGFRDSIFDAATAALHLTEREENSAKAEVKKDESEAAADVNAENEENASDEAADIKIPDYRIIGEAWNTYVIVELDTKLYLIDKHAAHERIIFERLKDNMRKANKNPSVQLLAVPIEILLSSDEASAVSEFAEEIRAAGFDFSLDGKKAVVTAVPQGFDAEMTSEAFMTFGDGLRLSPNEARDMLFERVLFTTSCKAAIKGGRAYGIEHIKWLCDELFRLPNVKYCPHGRPVILEFTKNQLDRNFGRIM
ncbi:MAG: DNA mismatch repair endonuclease MutL [Clostridiales bacterium]|nr:DNA mismatch repair endonuclease MutL [Clostridiales bacterium]